MLVTKESPAMPSPMESTQKKKFAGFGLNDIFIERTVAGVYEGKMRYFTYKPNHSPFQYTKMLPTLPLIAQARKHQRKILGKMVGKSWGDAGKHGHASSSLSVRMSTGRLMLSCKEMKVSVRWMPEIFWILSCSTSLRCLVSRQYIFAKML